MFVFLEEKKILDFDKPALSLDVITFLIFSIFPLQILVVFIINKKYPGDILKF